MAYLGPYGNLIRLYPVSSEEISSEATSVFKTTMGGRVVEQRGPRGRRSWNMGYDSAFPEDSGVIEAFILGARGKPPWAWVPPDAMSVNALTPLESLLDPSVIASGLFRGPGAFGPDGVRVLTTVVVPAGASSTVSERAGTAYFGTPVVEGETFTVSVYGRGVGGSLQAIFRNAGGGYLATHVVALGSTGFTRRSITAVAPMGAANVLLNVSAGSESLVFGGPAVTWTPTVQPWAVGRGCSKATIESSSESLIKAIRGRADHNRSGYSFVVRELG